MEGETLSKWKKIIITPHCMFIGPTSWEAWVLVAIPKSYKKSVLCELMLASCFILMMKLHNINI